MANHRPVAKMTDSRELRPTFYCLNKPDPADGRFVYGDRRWRSIFPSLDWTEDVHLESITCPATWKHRRAGSRKGDIRVQIGSHGIADFMWTFASECLVTDPVIEAFREIRVSGYNLRPVSVEIADGSPQGEVPTLHELVPTGQGGNAHPSSGIRVIYEHAACGWVVYSSFTNGIVVDPVQWDGSDIFTVIGYPKFMLASERVKHVIAEREFTNCALIPAQELQWGDSSRPEDMEYEPFDE